MLEALEGSTPQMGAVVEHLRDDIGDMTVAGDDVGIARMLVEVALRLVEGDLRQFAVAIELFTQDNKNKYPGGLGGQQIAKEFACGVDSASIRRSRIKLRN